MVFASLLLIGDGDPAIPIVCRLDGLGDATGVLFFEELRDGIGMICAGLDIFVGDGDGLGRDPRRGAGSKIGGVLTFSSGTSCPNDISESDSALYSSAAYFADTISESHC